MNVKTTPINSNTILNHCFHDIQINTTFVPGILQEPNQINSVLAENVAAVVSKNKNIFSDEDLESPKLCQFLSSHPLSLLPFQRQSEA